MASMGNYRCEITGQSFQISPLEQELRQKLGAPPPRVLPKFTFRQLMAFWPHWSLHKRKCDRTGKSLISIFGPDCPYPVWNREDWIQFANPPSVSVDLSRPFFPQLWELFQRCPIPHNLGIGNENCEYTDDWWYSKNCYLCHSGVHCEDCEYCYRIFGLRDSAFSVFSFHSELCFELVNSSNCFSVISAINCKNCHDSAFLFDCRNVSHCLLCWNLRNAKFCIRNVQLTEEEYLKERSRLKLTSRSEYNRLVNEFESIISTKAYWKAADVEHCVDSFGNFLEHCKNCENGYFFSDAEDSVNIVRGKDFRDCLDCVGPFLVERSYLSAVAQDRCYDVVCSAVITTCRSVDYCFHCYKCEDCFGCCGLVGKRFCVFNREYPEREYRELVARLKQKIAHDGDAGRFFPGHFAPNPYEESLAGFHFPLASEEISALGFRPTNYSRRKPEGIRELAEIPDSSRDVPLSLCDQVYWDERELRPFQISKSYLKFAQKSDVPLPDGFYTCRLKQLFRWLPFNGELRHVRCVQSGEEVFTTLPPNFDPLIVSRKAYESML